eukprot:6238389-Pyramimonas_sp.AAC.1
MVGSWSRNWPKPASSGCSSGCSLEVQRASGREAAAWRLGGREQRRLVEARDQAQARRQGDEAAMRPRFGRRPSRVCGEPSAGGSQVCAQPGDAQSIEQDADVHRRQLNALQRGVASEVVLGCCEPGW